MKEFFISYVLLHALLACSPKTNTHTTFKDSTPVCIQKRIQEIKREPVWSPPAEISEYTFNGHTVYLITANCCDQFVTVVDTGCAVICAPSGGYTGRGDGRCPDFNEKAKLIRLVWKDER